RVRDHIESKPRDRGNYTPAQNIFLVSTLVDPGNTMSDQPDDQPDTQLEHKRLRRPDNIHRIQDIRDGHADRSGQSAVPAAQDKRSEHAERISDVQGGSISSRQRDLNL